jgi:hypothetical protein
VTIELLSQPRNRHGAGRHAVRAEPDGAQSQCAERGKIPDEYSTNSSLPCLVRAGQRLHQPPDRWPSARWGSRRAGRRRGRGGRRPRGLGKEGWGWAQAVRGGRACRGASGARARTGAGARAVRGVPRGPEGVPQRSEGCGNPPPAPGFLGYPPDRGSRHRQGSQRCGLDGRGRRGERGRPGSPGRPQLTAPPQLTRRPV